MKALSIDDAAHVLWSNRSAAYLMLKDFESAAVDARRALDLNNQFVKSYFRLASAMLGNMKFVNELYTSLNITAFLYSD